MASEAELVYKLRDEVQTLGNYDTHKLEELLDEIKLNINRLFGEDSDTYIKQVDSIKFIPVKSYYVITARQEEESCWETGRKKLLKLLEHIGEDLTTGKTSRIATKSNKYVSEIRIQELKAIKSEHFDMIKLIRLCEEINVAHDNNLHLATIMLLRAILDHVPPIFSKTTFNEFASQYGKKSFKDQMQHLQNGARKIADDHLHSPIRKEEILPTDIQVYFPQNLDSLLAEVIRVLRTE